VRPAEACKHRFYPVRGRNLRRSGHLDPIWNELFPAEQARVIQLLVERVDVGAAGVDIRLRTEGLANLTAELTAVRSEQEAA
jgi:site-specific DNA recombinase